MKSSCCGIGRLLLGLSVAACGLGMAGVCTAYFAQEYKSGIVWPEPKKVDPGPSRPAAPVPSDAIVLLNGEGAPGLKGAEKWEFKDGYAVVRESGATSKQAFGDMQLHVEFATPPEVEGRGQGRGNSGIYPMGRYEVQVLDSYENETYYDGQMGAIYKQQPPTVNASRPPGQWQTLDIIFEAPRFSDDGELVKPAYITALHNGVVIHNHVELAGSTSYVKPPEYSKHPEKLPLHIQNHGDRVRYRNIWVRENIQPLVGKKPEEKEASNQDDNAKETNGGKTSG